MATIASILAEDEPGGLILRAIGDWRVAAAAELDRRLQGLALPSGKHVTVDLAGVERLDTAGAWLLLRTERALAGRGNTVELANLHPSFAPLLDHLRADTGTPMPHPVPSHHTLAGFIARIGEVTIGIARWLYSILGFWGLVTVTISRLLPHPRRLRLTATLVQIEQTGLNALPIVGLLSFLIGIVFAYQGSDQLRRFGAEIYTVNSLGIAILREFGVLLTSIIIRGRSGSRVTGRSGN